MKMKITSHFFLLAALCGCTPATIHSPPISAWAKEKWTTGCQPDQHDPYGKLIERAKCWAMISDFQQANEGTSVGVATIFEIDANGPRLTSNPDLDPDVCPEKPTRMAVDGMRIDKFPMARRIEAVLDGRRFTREKDRGWPYCNVYNETMSVRGARAAYDEMVAKWANR